MKNVYRHGDVNLIACKLPKDAKLIEESKSLIIAFGEQTGHNHTLVAEPTTRFRIFEHEGNRYFVLNTKATLTHPEHKTITVFPDVYIQGQEREVDHFNKTVRRVID